MHFISSKHFIFAKVKLKWVGLSNSDCPPVFSFVLIHHPVPPPWPSWWSCWNRNKFCVIWPVQNADTLHPITFSFVITSIRHFYSLKLRNVWTKLLAYHHHATSPASQIEQSNAWKKPPWLSPSSLSLMMPILQKHDNGPASGEWMALFIYLVLWVFFLFCFFLFFDDLPLSQCMLDWWDF